MVLDDIAVNIIPVESEHEEDILHIVEAQFGTGTGYILKLAERGEKVVSLVALYGPNVVGYVEAEVVEYDDIKDWFHPDRISTLPKTMLKHPIGYGRMLAVDLTYHNRGIGSQLIKAAEVELARRGVRDILAAGWVNAAYGSQMKNLMDSCDFETIAFVPGFWQEECDAQKFLCPHRTNSCNCAAEIFHKNIQKKRITKAVR